MTPDRAAALAMLRAMIRVRRLEERCAEDYAAGKIRGFLHLYIGEEAIAAGVVPALGPADSIVGTYREHAHALLRGVSAAAIMAEMYGRAGGCSRGRGGSMHLFSREHRFLGGHGIVGGGLPVAVGVAPPRASSTSRSTSRRCGGCRCCSRARTTAGGHAGARVRGAVVPRVHDVPVTG